MSYFEGSKVYIAELVIFVLLIINIFSKEGINLKNYNKSLLVSSLILFILTSYHLVFNNSLTTFFGNSFRLQGAFLLWCLIVFSIISSKIRIDKSIKPQFIFGILLVQFIAAILFIGVGADRPVGTLGEPNALSADVLFLWPFLFFPHPKNMKSWTMGGVGILLVAIILVISGSRSGLIAFGIQVAFLYLLRAFYNRPLMPVVISVLLIIGSLAIPILFSRGDLYENRFEIWNSSINAAKESPLIGVGFGNAEYSLHASNLKLNNHLPGYYVDSSHNIFLDWLLQGGIVGLCILIFLLFKTFSSYIIMSDTRYIVLLLGLIASLSFNPASVVSLVALWWLIGQGARSLPA